MAEVQVVTPGSVPHLASPVMDWHRGTASASDETSLSVPVHRADVSGELPCTLYCCSSGTDVDYLTGVVVDPESDSGACPEFSESTREPNMHHSKVKIQVRKGCYSQNLQMHVPSHGVLRQPLRLLHLTSDLAHPSKLVYGMKLGPGYRSKMEDYAKAVERAFTVNLLYGEQEALIPGPILENSLFELDFPSADTIDTLYKGQFSFHVVGVFDGHGGTEVAEQLSEKLPDCIAKFVYAKQERVRLGVTQSEEISSQMTESMQGTLFNPLSGLMSWWTPPIIVRHDSQCQTGKEEMEIDNLNQSQDDLSKDELSFSSNEWCDTNNSQEVALSLGDMKQAITEAFEHFNQTLPEVQDRTVGSTAVVSLISDQHIIVANVGDSRAVLRRDGVDIRLSRDHKPDQEDEEERIKQCGGRVWDFNGRRVMGLLAMTRAFGDDCLKAFGICAKPEVTILPRSRYDEFIILACDGLWDVVSDEEACELVDRCFKRAKERNASSVSACRVAASVLFRAAFAKGSNDNISVVVVDLRNYASTNNL